MIDARIEGDSRTPHVDEEVVDNPVAGTPGTVTAAGAADLLGRVTEVGDEDEGIADTLRILAIQVRQHAQAGTDGDSVVEDQDPVELRAEDGQMNHGVPSVREGHSPLSLLLFYMH